MLQVIQFVEKDLSPQERNFSVSRVAFMHHTIIIILTYLTLC